MKLVKNESPIAVLLGLADTGYGIVRSLAIHKIPIVAFEWDKNKSIWPEFKTALCDLVFVKNEEELLKSLIKLQSKLGYKPTLFISSDIMVTFYSQYRDDLAEKYLIHFPPKDSVDLLMEKTLFSTFALKYNFRIPKTFDIKSKNDIHECLANINLPCILKPIWRNKEWGKAGFPKAFYFDNEDVLHTSIIQIFNIENNLVVQEWIPGSDDNIYFCLVYFDGKSKCIAYQTGRKLRQWPVGTGSTSCAEPIEEQDIKKETLRLFETVPLYKGFGSVEFKKHAIDGKYYIMEPTVGRPDHQSYLATANGMNMPVIAYNQLNNIKTKPIREKYKNYIWIDDPVDLASVLVNLIRRQFSFVDFIKQFISKKSFRYFNAKDPMPFIYLWSITIPYKIFKKILHYFIIQKT